VPEAALSLLPKVPFTLAAVAALVTMARRGFHKRHGWKVVTATFCGWAVGKAVLPVIYYYVHDRGLAALPDPDLYILVGCLAGLFAGAVGTKEAWGL
jgi:hypothetical protein